MKKEMVDYRKLRPWNLTSAEFRHLWLLLYWIFFGLMFLLAEQGVFASQYTPVYTRLDDKIPFCEYFVIPYLFWFVYLTGVHIYTLLLDVGAFKRLMYFIMVTYSITMTVYILFPTCQELRPLEFERDNIFTRFLTGFYQFDTNTNVCPSIHVIGSVAAMFAYCDSKYMRTAGWRVANVIVTLFISASTVFLKQHSILDVLAAVVVCAIGYAAVYGRAAFSAGKSGKNIVAGAGNTDAKVMR